MRLLGVFAHPDDETYTVGGCLVRCEAGGIATTILTFTRGEAGQISPGSDATRDSLGRVREAELREACRILGCRDVRIVGTPDSATTVTEEGVEAIVRVLRELRPAVVVTMEPEGITRHPDHMAVSEMTRLAVESVRDEGFVDRLYMGAIPQTMFDAWTAGAAAAGGSAPDLDDPLAPRPAPDETIACIVDVGDAVKRKIEALWAHRTQSQEFVATQPPEVVEMTMRLEAFQRAWPPFSAGEPIAGDLFEGLR